MFHLHSRFRRRGRNLRILPQLLRQPGVGCRIFTVQVAHNVRQAIQQQDWELLKTLVPQTTLDYFLSPASEPVRKRITQAGNVIHY